MSETQKFAEIEKTLEGLRGLSDLPEVDLCIRTGGEYRISNFLLWQLAYAEFVFVDAFWPDFQKEEMQGALDQFSRRQRNFGNSGARSFEDPRA